MSDFEIIEGKQTKWEGLWWHPENQQFTSKPLSPESLSGFRGDIRLIVKKNKYYQSGKNGRPNYNFTIREVAPGKTQNAETKEEHDLTWYQNRVRELEAEISTMYSKDQVQQVINRALEDGKQGFSDRKVSDYLGKETE